MSLSLYIDYRSRVQNIHYLRFKAKLTIIVDGFAENELVRLPATPDENALRHRVSPAYVTQVKSTYSFDYNINVFEALRENPLNEVYNSKTERYWRLMRDLCQPEILTYARNLLYR